MGPFLNHAISKTSDQASHVHHHSSVVTEARERGTWQKPAGLGSIPFCEMNTQKPQENKGLEPENW